MIVLVMDNAPANLRGELCKWLLEIKPAVFVGSVSATVRERLWLKVCEKDITGAILVYPYKNEQGFEMKIWGVPRRSLVDFEGITLVTRKTEAY